jgi:hypothetical protein
MVHRYPERGQHEQTHQKALRLAVGHLAPLSWLRQALRRRLRGGLPVTWREFIRLLNEKLTPEQLDWEIAAVEEIHSKVTVSPCELRFVNHDDDIFELDLDEPYIYIP